MGHALEIVGVEQAFRTGFWLKPVRVLKQVNLVVPEKTIFGFIGANGAGKTTLIQLIVGMREPTQGQVHVMGQPATSREARFRVGYLPERPYFYDHLTGFQTLEYFGSLSGLSPRDVRARAPRVLGAVGLQDVAKLELRKYSKGMLQRIGIAQAILHDPQILVLDEPMSGLDPLGRKEIRELILNLASEGRTVFFSSHVLPDVEAICDQVAWIQKGEILGNAAVASILSHESEKFELWVSGVKLQNLVAWGGDGALEQLRETPEGVRFVVPNEAMASAILAKVVADRSARLLHYAPVRVSLESMLGKDFYRRSSS